MVSSSMAMVREAFALGRDRVQTMGPRSVGCKTYLRDMITTYIQNTGGGGPEHTSKLACSPGIRLPAVDLIPHDETPKNTYCWISISSWILLVVRLHLVFTEFYSFLNYKHTIKDFKYLSSRCGSTIFRFTGKIPWEQENSTRISAFVPHYCTAVGNQRTLSFSVNLWLELQVQNILVFLYSKKSVDRGMLVSRPVI